MKNILKVISILMIVILFIACNSSSKVNDNDNEKTYLIKHYKHLDFTYLMGQKMGSTYQYSASRNSKDIHIDTIKDMDYNYGYRYKIEAENLDYEDVTAMSMLKLIEKTFTPLPFNTLHELKYFKAENTKDNEYTILHELNIRILDKDIQRKFDEIIIKSDALNFESENNERFKLYFEFDYNELNETINFIKLTDIIEQ